MTLLQADVLDVRLLTVEIALADLIVTLLQGLSRPDYTIRTIRRQRALSVRRLQPLGELGQPA